jgi:hypothetical protein
VFGIKHYWGRFEFAKSRGQIHLHLLGITDDATGEDGIYTKLFRLKGKRKKQINLLAKWARRKFNCTAEINLENKIPAQNESPCKRRFRECQNIEDDAQDLSWFCQIHRCSEYCMRKSKEKKNTDSADTTQKDTNKTKVSIICLGLLHQHTCFKGAKILILFFSNIIKITKKRFCRMGCGKESMTGNCDTPGWKVRTTDTIDNDIRGFKKLFLTRNHPKYIQTSLHCLQSWRANCDISILIYESDPMNPDVTEIAKVTDYVINYACKGNATLAIERKQVKDFTLQCESETGDEKDVIKTVQKCLNRSVASRTITKQEAVCQIGKLPLVICSESIDTISLSGAMRVSNGVNSNYKTFLSEYNTRTTHLDKSLHQFFHLTKKCYKVTKN